MSRVVCMRDAALHYAQEGAGPPLVFVHGGGTDLTYWDAQLPAFAAHYRVVAYSRRYAEPNRNAPIASDYSARTDADDLAQLITSLELGAVHIVAHSIGAVAALFCAAERPDLVRTLVLAEPPILRWACGEPGGDVMFEKFLREMWEPAGAAFREGNSREGMRLVTDYFVGAGTFTRLPKPVRERVMRNARDWEAFTISSTPFPPLERETVAGIEAPALLLSAGRTVPLHRLVDDVLAETLQDAERVHVADATHDIWADQPDRCREATLDFLTRHRTV